MKSVKVILKGMWVGSTMTVPGVSGGTMAVIVGIYEQLIHATNGLKNEPKKYLPFIMKFLLGATIGFVAFARGITFLLNNYNTAEITKFFFCGIVIGGIPLLVKKSELKKSNLNCFLWMSLGAIVVLSLNLIPYGIFTSDTGIKFFIMQLIGGVIVAIALILPGISVTHMLLILGMYEIVLERIYAFKVLELIPLVIGVTAGIFFTTNILEKLINNYTTQVYMVIIGFVAGSVVTLLPADKINSPVSGIIALLAGCVIMYKISKNVE